MADPRAGTPATDADLVDVPQLVTAYFSRTPDPDDPDQQVVFGTSGHRGSSLRTAFNEAHLVGGTHGRGLQRGAHRGDDPGDLRLPQAAGVRRPPVPRPRHPCALRAGVRLRGGGA